MILFSEHASRRPRVRGRAGAPRRRCRSTAPFPRPRGAGRHRVVGGAPRGDALGESYHARGVPDPHGVHRIAIIPKMPDRPLAGRALPQAMSRGAGEPRGTVPERPDGPLSGPCFASPRQAGNDLRERRGLDTLACGVVAEPGLAADGRGWPLVRAASHVSRYRDRAFWASAQGPWPRWGRRGLARHRCRPRFAIGCDGPISGRRPFRRWIDAAGRWRERLSVGWDRRWYGGRQRRFPARMDGSAPMSGPGDPVRITVAPHPGPARRDGSPPIGLG